MGPVAHDVHVSRPVEFVIDKETEVSDIGGGFDLVVCCFCQYSEMDGHQWW